MDFTLSSSTFSRDGYAQIGWAITDGGSMTYTLGGLYTTNAAITLYPVWASVTIPTEAQTLSKIILTSESAGTLSGFNGKEYAGTEVIAGLSGTATADVDDSHEGKETGYKLNTGGTAKVFATLAKGTFQVGDIIKVTITKQNDAFKVDEVKQSILDIYCGASTDSLVHTITDVTGAGTYSYTLTASDITKIGNKTHLGVWRPSSGRTQNQHIYSVELIGKRSWQYTVTPTPDLNYATFSSTYNTLVPEGVEAYTGVYSTGTLTLAALTDEDHRIIPANTPVVLKAPSGRNVTLTATGESASFDGTNDLIGTYEESVSASGINKAYVLGYFNDGNPEHDQPTGFYMKSSGTILANRAYLEIAPAAAPSAIRIVEGEQNTTSVETIEANEQVIKLFENGMLYIKRDGITYDVTGRIVR